MQTTNKSKSLFRPVRHVTIIGSTTKTARNLKSLLKQSSYYCLIDCYKKEEDLVSKETFYLPDCAIIEVRSVQGLGSIHKKAERLQAALPGIKVVLYYNMLIRYPVLENNLGQYPALVAGNDAEKQLNILDEVLKEYMN